MSGYTMLKLKDVDNAGAHFGLPEEDFGLRMARDALGGDVAEADDAEEESAGERETDRAGTS